MPIRSAVDGLFGRTAALGRFGVALVSAAAASGLAGGGFAQTTSGEGPSPATASNTVVTSPPTPSAPCSDSAFRQLDFWVGAWDLSWSLPDGGTGTGRNVITNDAYGACVVTERFSMPGFTGMSVSTFHVPSGRWRQTWVDDQGGYYALTGGATPGTGHVFEFVADATADAPQQLRMIWQDVTADAMIWRWQSRASNAAPWADQWVINYRRTEPSAD